MPTHVLKSMADLQRALRLYPTRVKKSVIKSLRSSARFGQTAAVYTTKRTRTPLPIRASGSYENSWIAQDLNDGALVANAIKYSEFVERGRKAGKRPPYKAILAWVKAKRIVKRMKGPSQRGKEGRLDRRRMKSAHKAGQEDLARSIQRAIGKRGTLRMAVPPYARGYWVLHRTKPRIFRFAVRESAREIRKLNARSPL